MWNYIKDGAILLGCCEAYCYITKRLVYHLTDKFESPENYIVDPKEKKMINKYLNLPTPIDFIYGFKATRKK